LNRSLPITLIFLILIFPALAVIIERTNQDSLQDIRKPAIEKFIHLDHQGKGIVENPVHSEMKNDIEEGVSEEQRSETESYLVGWILVALASPLFLPQKLLGDDYSENFYYQDYPFCNSEGFTDFEGKKWMISGSTSFQYVNKNTWGYHLNSSFGFLRFSMAAAYSNFECKNTQNKSNISAFAASASFTFAQNRFLNFSSGLGYQHFKTAVKRDGLKWIYRIRFFQKPVNLDLNYGLILYELDNISSKTAINEFLADLGILIGRFEFKINYRLFTIINEKLNGPGFSLQLWF